MNIIKTKNYEEMSRTAAILLSKAIAKGTEKRTNIAVTAGSTPKRMYEILKEILPQSSTPFVEYYNFDEIPLRNQKEGVTMGHLRDAFYTPCNIAESQIHIFDETNYQNFDTIIEADGGLDMIMIGLGKDGHFCGNLSGTLDCFDEGCRSVNSNLNQTLANRIAFLSGGEEHKTEFYVTYGPKTVMHARQIIMIASGVEKAQMVKEVIQGTIRVSVPSTIFQLHPNFTLIADEDALSLVTK